MFDESAPHGVRRQLAAAPRPGKQGFPLGAASNLVAAERRQDRRRGVRLNWGKALDASDRFLCECLVVNRSRGGARVRLARRIGLPLRFHFFDDAEKALYDARVVWRQGDLVGCRLALSPLRNKQEVVKRMSGRYYAV
jgi:hypothetical protein